MLAIERNAEFGASFTFIFHAEPLIKLNVMVSSFTDSYSKKTDEDVLPVFRLSIFPLLKLMRVTVKNNIVCREQQISFVIDLYHCALIVIPVGLF